MKLRLDQLDAQLQRPLSVVYLVSGDEPLLVMEACDRIRAAAVQQGFDERQLFHAESGFDWNGLREEANALSLFASRRLLEVRIPNGKPSDKGDCLKALVSTPNPDNLLLIVCPKLDNKIQKTSWYKAIDKAGVLIAVWPIERNQYPGWIRQRFQQAGLQADSEAVNYLAHQTEGNLLSAVQEIEKLRISGNNPICLELLQSSTEDQSRFDAFAFADACLAGDTETALRVLNHLKAEGLPPLSILGAVTLKLRQLCNLTGLQGDSLSQAFKQANIWPKQQSLYRKTIQRVPESTLLKALKLSESTDRAAKGSGDDPWRLLGELAVLISDKELCKQLG